MKTLYRSLLLVAFMVNLHGMNQDSLSSKEAIHVFNDFRNVISECKPSQLCLLIESSISLDSDLLRPFDVKGYNILHIIAGTMPFNVGGVKELIYWLYCERDGQEEELESDLSEEEGAHPNEILFRKLPKFKRDIIAEMKRNNRLFLCNVIKGYTARKIRERSKKAYERIFAVLLTFHVLKTRQAINLPRDIRYMILSIDDDLAFDVLSGFFDKKASVSDTLEESGLKGAIRILGKNRMIDVIDVQVHKGIISACEQKNDDGKLPYEVDSYNFGAYIFDPITVSSELHFLIRDMLNQKYMDPEEYALDEKGLYEFLLKLDCPKSEFNELYKSCFRKKLEQIN